MRFMHDMRIVLIQMILGQAEAIKLGIGRALLIHDPELKPLLRQGKVNNRL